MNDDEEMKYYFDNYDRTDPLEPRDALYGGQTNAAKLYHECDEHEKIRQDEKFFWWHHVLLRHVWRHVLRHV